MPCSAADRDVHDSLINSFALVAYLPEPLGACVEALRRQAHSQDERGHVTILPPRPLACLEENAAAELEIAAASLQPFWVELREVLVFPSSGVLYLSIGEGAQELIALHATLGQARLRFLEYFEYHPHVTLAMSLPRADLARTAREAARQWSSYTGPRRFLLDRMTLVRNTRNNHWRNLREFQLGAPVTV